MTSITKTEQQHLIEAEIKAAVDRFMKIFATGDAAAIAATYSSNPVVGAPTGDLVFGQAQLLQFWQSVLNGLGIRLDCMTAYVCDDVGKTAIQAQKHL
jgi:ketosteroid isomerase-like protein